MLWAHCLYLDVIWTEIYIKKPVYLFFPFRPWLKIAGFRRGRLFAYTALLAAVGKREILSFVFVPEAGRKLFNKYYCRSFHYIVRYLPIFLVIAVQKQVLVVLSRTRAFAIHITMALYLKDLIGKSGPFYKVQIFHHTSALSATFSHYGLLNQLWGQGIYFWFQCFFLQIPISTPPQLFFCLKRSKVSIFYVLEKSDECYLPDLLLDRDCGAGVGRETRNCRVNQY